MKTFFKRLRRWFIRQAGRRYWFITRNGDIYYVGPKSRGESFTLIQLYRWLAAQEASNPPIDVTTDNEFE